MHDPLPVDWNAIPWEAVRDGVERKLCLGSEATLAMHRVSVAAVNPAHSHPNEQFIYVLAGRLEYKVDNRSYLLERGDVLVVPPNVVHQSRTVSTEPAVTLDVFAPRRDY
jgi:quercetin dioxygenase-like cupin family protein